MPKQYYYKNTDCKAKSCEDKDCICWHDIDSGPVPTGVAWREKQVVKKPRIKYVSAYKSYQCRVDRIRGCSLLAYGKTPLQAYINFVSMLSVAEIRRALT